MQPIDWLTEKIRTRCSVAFVIGASFLVAGWTLDPLISPYVRVPGNTLTFKFPCIPIQVEIDGTFQSQPSSTRMTIQSPGRESLPAFSRTLMPIRTLTPIIQGKASSGTLYLSATGADMAGLNAISATSSRPFETELELTAAGSTFLDVNHIVVSRTPTFPVGGQYCSAIDAHGIKVLDYLISGDVKIMRWRVLQEDFAKVVYRFNATIGNILIAILAITAVWLVYDLLDAFFEKIPNSQTSLATKIAEVEASFLERFRLLNLWRAIGPAMGFMLTVSSLVESLRPATQSSQNAYAFISGIQMAVVATFLGLAIRILCELDINIREGRAVKSIRALEGEEK